MAAKGPAGRTASSSEPAAGPSSDVFVDVSRAYGQIPCFQRLLPLVLKSNPHTYLSMGNGAGPLAASWLALAMRGMENLRRRGTRATSAAAIGTGCGLDAVGISHLFVPREIIASDIHPRALDAARWNTTTYAHRETHCEVVQSDLFRQFPLDRRFDLIYENLPNVPEDRDVLGGIRAASCYRPALYPSDPISDRLLLTLHYCFLLEARDRLEPDGWIVSMIGGRVPWAAIRDMFARAGFAATILHFGLKTQTEPGVVLDGYARAEERGSPPFAFYHPVEACRPVLARYGSEPGADGGEERAAAIHSALERHRVSAREAWDLHLRGEHVCHSVYVVGAKHSSASRPER